VLAAANFRPAVTSVGPVLEDIRVDIGLSGSAAAALTGLPLLCFGAGALLAPRLARRFGLERTLLAVLALTTVGLFVRVGPSTVTLFGGTFLLGAAIAVGNVLVPTLIKREYAHRPGAMMGLYVGVMMAMASVAAGVTVPLGQALGGGWRVGLGAWGVPALAAFLVWLAGLVRRERRSGAEPRVAELPVSLFRDRVAWQVTLFMGLQSMTFYAVMSWLPSIYRGYGVSPEDAGRLLFTMLLVGVPAALVMPSVLTRSRQQSGWVAATAAIFAVGLVAIIVAPMANPVLWALLLGIGSGTAFPVALTLVVLRTRGASDAAGLSGMSQSVGYTLTALGPLLFGLLHDLSGAWTVPILAMIVLLVPQTLAGVLAGRPVHVGERAGWL
jgi:CP family cyanate transporter-like MFS transporter